MSAIYESDKVLSEYLLFHFGTADEILPPGRNWPAGMREALDFARRTPAHFTSGNVSRGLDLGCAVGRSAFEMSATCDEVIGIDFSHAFIRAAEALRNGESLAYERREEASISTRLQAHAGMDIDGSKLRFLQGDAMDLPEELGSFLGDVKGRGEAAYQTQGGRQSKGLPEAAGTAVEAQTVRS